MAWINSSLCFVGKLSAKQVTAVYRSGTADCKEITLRGGIFTLTKGSVTPQGFHANHWNTPECYSEASK